MPIHEEDPRFWRDWALLPSDQRCQFVKAMRKMVRDLKAGQALRKGLRIEGIQGHPGVFEMTWADDGRATFRFGASVLPASPHIIWQRIGTHDILSNP
jgi:hypothetical protein